jgi:hypothetical protein
MVIMVLSINIVALCVVIEISRSLKARSRGLYSRLGPVHEGKANVGQRPGHVALAADVVAVEERAHRRPRRELR